jgi:hypothetical protein
MATSILQASPPGVYVPPRGRTYQLYLTIDGFPYSVRPVLSDPFLARRAFQLTKPDGKSYDIAQTHHGATCDCPDFIYRRDGLDPAGCKHVRALVSCGLIDRTGPTGPGETPARPKARSDAPS